MSPVDVRKLVLAVMGDAPVCCSCGHEDIAETIAVKLEPLMARGLRWR
mgnify:CR=1 FL=1